MSGKVFVNGRAVACKAASGKSVAAFPDVCLSPPAPPSGPASVPYPSTGSAKDACGGSKQVKIGGKEVMLQDSSYFKKTTGDEAATKAQGMGVLTGQIQGKAYFNSWSMDVMIEGKHVPRHMDLMTHNHASMPGNTPPNVYLDTMVTPDQLDIDTVEFQLLDDADKPIVGEDYLLTLPDGSTRPGVTDGDGIARATGVQPGSCRIEFSKRDNALYDKV